MIRLGPVQLMVIGFALLVLGVVLPFLMILKILESTLLLGFISYLVSFGGVILGFVGIVTYTSGQRHNKD